ncbi:MAG TPA: energy transducer TonB [Terriglobales bacterium]|nr:energy transducer TonB [Terriglobales bacterium]
MPADDKQLSHERRFAPQISVLLHCIVLVWLVHTPSAIFVAPSSVMRGEGGTRVTALYWPGRRMGSGNDEVSVSTPLSVRRSPRAQIQWSKPAGKGERGSASEELARGTSARSANNAPSAGSRYGSLSEGPIAGEEISPALPIEARDPVVYPWELAGKEGDVVIEITIDEAGKIVDKRVLRSMGPAIDEKVLAALEEWHFQPARRDGLPIPSKQDVHYHFKPS